MQETIYKLYHNKTGYKCRMNYQELIFIFEIKENLTLPEINRILNTFNYHVENTKL